MSFEERIDFNQQIREQLVKEMLLANSGRCPDDPKVATVMLKALKDSDSSELGRRKLDIEQGAADSNRQVNEAFLEQLKQNGDANPFMRQADGSAIPLPQVDVAKLGHHEIDQGEMYVGVVEETAADFLKRADEQGFGNFYEDDDE